LLISPKMARWQEFFAAKAKRLVIPLKPVYLPNESHCKTSRTGRRSSFDLTIISRGVHHLIRKQMWMVRMFLLQPVKGFRKIKSATNLELMRKSVRLKETLLPLSAMWIRQK